MKTITLIRIGFVIAVIGVMIGLIRIPSNLDYILTLLLYIGSLAFTYMLGYRKEGLL